MPDLNVAQTKPDAPPKPAAPQQTPGQVALASWEQKRFLELSRARWYEEREWYQSAMFD